MKFSTSSLVLASLAISGTTLAAPTPPMPFDSPVPNSPKPDDWTESVRSPRIPRSPMVPAIRVAGRRQSIPRFKRQDDGSAPASAPDGGDAGDADTANAQGLLGGLGDALDGTLHQVEGVLNGLPIIGGLGILSEDGSTDPFADPAANPPDPSQPQKRQAPVPSPPQPPVDPTQQAQQEMAMLMQQQQQQQQASAALHAASANLPIDPFMLQQRLQVLREQQLAGIPLVGNAFSGNGLGVLSTVGGLAGGLPVVGGVLAPNGLVGGLLGTVQGDLSGLLGTTGLGNVLGGMTGTANSLLGGVLGSTPAGNAPANLLGNVLGGGYGNPQAQSYQPPAQLPHYPDATGFYPHSIPTGAPTVSPNSPVPNPTAFAFGSFAVDDASDNIPVAPPAPPSTPVANGASVPMDHDDPSPTDVTAPTETVPLSAPAPTPSVSTPTRRRVDGDILGEGSLQAQLDDSADGFTPSVPDPNYTPPLLAQAKRSECNGASESAMHEGGCDAVPGPQDALKRSLTAPRPRKMFRRRLRGASVSF